MHPSRYPTPSDRPGAAVRTRSFLHQIIDDERGIAIATVALVAVALIGFTAVTFSRTGAAMDRVSGDRVWEQSLFVAEGGIDMAMDTLDDNPAYATGESYVDFTDRASVIAMADAHPATDVIPTPEGEVVILKPGDATVIFAVGYTPSRDAADRQVRVLWAGYEAGSGWTIGLPEGALVANGNIKMTGTTDTFTVTGSHQADAISNGNFTGTGGASVDGYIMAVGSVTLTGSSGAYWESLSGQPAFDIPNAAEKMAFQQAMLDGATGAGSTTIAGDIRATTTIDAPAYITGDIRLSGSKTLTITGSGTVYVAGDIRLTGSSQIINGGAVLAVAGTITQTGQTQYNATGSLHEVGLVSFATDDGAITMTGGSDAFDQGIVWAVNGGIDMSGGSSFKGALIATGIGSDGIINMTGGAAVHYIPDLIEHATFGPTPAAAVTVDDMGEM